MKNYLQAVYVDNIKTAFVAAAILTAGSFLIAPLIKLLTLPLNILTLGSFSWIANTVTFYITLRLVDGFSINRLNFPGFSWGDFSLSPAKLPFLISLIIIVFLFSLVSNILESILKA